jgi:hypothetical protein
MPTNKPVSVTRHACQVDLFQPWSSEFPSSLMVAVTQQQASSKPGKTVFSSPEKDEKCIVARFDFI